MNFAGGSAWQVKRQRREPGSKNELGDGIFLTATKGKALASHAGKIPALSVHNAELAVTPRLSLPFFPVAAY